MARSRKSSIELTAYDDLFQTEISYLSEEQQYTLLEAMEYNDATPSLAQAINIVKSMR